jgi:hypothetical protein
VGDQLLLNGLLPSAWLNGKRVLCSKQIQGRVKALQNFEYLVSLVLN